MQVFLAQLVNGLALGSIYVLLVTGFNLMLLVGKIIQFAYPHIVVFSMYTCWKAFQITESIIASMLICVVVATLINVLTEPIFRRVMSARGQVDINATFVLALGMSMVITDLISHQFNYGFPISFPEIWIGKQTLIRFGLISVSEGQIYALCGGIIAVIAFFYLLYRRRHGRVFRAVAENISLARLIGIPIVRTNIFSYGIAGILGGLIAILLSMLLGSASPWLGDFVALKVLAVSIVAGLGNLKGGLVCGLFLGIAEAMAMGYFPGSWSNTIAFTMMLVVVLIKPKGLFGTQI
jgi:branched-chain amino acid transport system permease protein